MASFSSLPSSLTTVMLLFLPKGGLDRIMLKRSDGGLARASATWIGESSLPISWSIKFMAARRAVLATISQPCRASVRRCFFLVPVKIEVVRNVVMRGQQEARRATGGVGDGVVRLGAHDIHHGLNERAWGEILARAALGVLGVLLQQALVGVPLDVGIQARPRLLVNEIGNEATEFGGVLDLVLGLAEDDAEHPRHLAEGFQGVSVVDFQGVAVEGGERRPSVLGGDDSRPVPGGLGALVGHFEEKQVGELLDIVPVGEAIIAEQVAVVPKFGDQRRRSVVSHIRISTL